MWWHMVTRSCWWVQRPTGLWVLEFRKRAPWRRVGAWEWEGGLENKIWEHWQWTFPTSHCCQRWRVGGGRRQSLSLRYFRKHFLHTYEKSTLQFSSLNLVLTCHKMVRAPRRHLERQWMEVKASARDERSINSDNNDVFVFWVAPMGLFQSW